MTEQYVDTLLPALIDLPRMIHGSDFHWSWQHFEDDQITPKNTTNYSAVMIIRASPNGEVYATLTTGGLITMTAATGLFNVDIPAAIIDTYNFSIAYYLVIITDATSGKTATFEGRIVLEG